MRRSSFVTIGQKSAIERNGDTAYVYHLANDLTVHAHPIQDGASNEGKTEILSGLEPGDVVVTRGFDKLQDGTRVSTSQSSSSDAQGRNAQ